MATTREKITRHPDLEPAHPGEFLREMVLPHMGLSITAAAERLGVSRKQLHKVLACTASVTPEMALRIGKLCGNGPNVWLAMQQANDLWHAERKLARELAKIETVKQAA